MPYLMVKLSVEDFAKWKDTFEGLESDRINAGSKGGHIFRNVDDQNQVVVILEMEDLDRAREFLGSPQTQQAMQEAGVTGPPEILFLDEVDRPTG
jgi:uncharacterized protein (DUF1330 family)